MALLEIKNLGISFGGLRAVDDFSITIEKGQLYGLIGPNGAGKTTIFNLLTGVYKPNMGTIQLDGMNITQITVYKARNLLYDPDKSTYEPAYKTQVTTYIERILRHATGDFKQDNIVQFFSNNPKSQKSLWLAKKDCVNAVVEEGDSLDYSIDETTGICDLTIYFDGNARNLEVMISRVSSK